MTKPCSPYRALFLLLIAFACSSPLLATDLSQPSHRLHVRSDFDGDAVLDTAVVRHHDTHYTLSIHFSRTPSKTFRAYLSNEPVLGIASMDVDGDRDRDIVLIGLNPLLPVGLWVNEKAGKFHRETAWAGIVARENSLHLLHQGASENQAPDTLLEPIPDASIPERLHFTLVRNDSELSSQARRFPLSGQSFTALSRGPPLNS